MFDGTGVSIGGFVETDFTSISSLTITKVFGSALPRLINKLTVVPFSPLILSAALSMEMPLVLFPSISRILSSAFNFTVGVSESGSFDKPLC